MEHRETEEMHEAVDQALRAALMAVGSVAQRRARREQVAADRARVAAAGTRAELNAYLAAQDTMLRHSLRAAMDPTFFDTTTRAERVATRDMAHRYAEVSPVAAAVLDRIDTEATRRGETLTPPDTDTAPEESVTTETQRSLGGDRRRPVAADTTATEQEVAERLAATRSFPRTLWAELKHSAGATLRPGSPTTLPRTRDTGLDR